MKALPFVALGALAFSIIAAPAFAQSEAAPVSSGAWYAPSGFYGNLGYSNLSSAESPYTDLNAITGRFGARFGRYLGLEAEASGGVGSDTRTLDGDQTRTHLNDQYAGYVVGFLPVMPHLDLLARVGYGGQDYSLRDDYLNTNVDHEFGSINYGAGAQYMFDGVDGVRVDYTRYQADSRYNPDSNVVSLAFVRRF